MRIAIVAVLLSACGSTPPKPVETPPVPAPAPVPVVAMTPPAPPKHAWPETKTGTTVDQLHDVPVKDPYRWLEDEHAADVQAWMKEEDDYARGELAKLPGRAELAARMKELLYYDALGAPVHHGGRYFFSRKHADKEKTI